MQVISVPNEKLSVKKKLLKISEKQIKTWFRHRIQDFAQASRRLSNSTATPSANPAPPLKEVVKAGKTHIKWV